MSTKYTDTKKVPTEIICRRLNELSKSVTGGSEEIQKAFSMRVPAELDRDADLVISEASDRLNRFVKLIAAIKANDIEIFMETGKYTLPISIRKDIQEILFD